MTSQANTFHAPQSSRGCPRGPLAPHLIPEQNALPSDSEQLQEFEYVCHGVLVSCHMHSNLRTLNDTSAGKACILLALCESFRTVCSVMVAASLCPTYSRRWLAGTAFSEYLYLILRNTVDNTNTWRQGQRRSVQTPQIRIPRRTSMARRHNSGDRLSRAAEGLRTSRPYIYLPTDRCFAGVTLMSGFSKRTSSTTVSRVMLSTTKW